MQKTDPSNDPQFTRALTAALNAARSKFDNSNLRRWIEEAIDAATDAVQAAWSRYDRKRGPFTPFAASYVSRRLKSLLRDKSRQAARRSVRITDYGDGIDDMAEMVGSAHGAAADLMQSLTPLQKSTLISRFLQGDSVIDIARSRGVSRWSVYRVQERAKRRIRKEYQDSEPRPG